MFPNFFIYGMVDNINNIYKFIQIMIYIIHLKKNLRYDGKIYKCLFFFQ